MEGVLEMDNSSQLSAICCQDQHNDLYLVLYLVQDMDWTKAGSGVKSNICCNLSNNTLQLIMDMFWEIFSVCPLQYFDDHQVRVIPEIFLSAVPWNIFYCL